MQAAQDATVEMKHIDIDIEGQETCVCVTDSTCILLASQFDAAVGVLVYSNFSGRNYLCEIFTCVFGILEVLTTYRQFEDNPFPQSSTYLHQPIVPCLKIRLQNL